jgi:hypothetical protein
VAYGVCSIVALDSGSLLAWVAAPTWDVMHMYEADVGIRGHCLLVTPRELEIENEAKLAGFFWIDDIVSPRIGQLSIQISMVSAQDRLQ